MKLVSGLCKRRNRQADKYRPINRVGQIKSITTLQRQQYVGSESEEYCGGY